MSDPRRLPETPAEWQLSQELRAMAAVMASHLAPPDDVYQRVFDFLLQHSAFYTPTPAPEGFFRGVPQCCYGNAIVAAVLHWRIQAQTQQSPRCITTR
jgi:hypothetical protein